MCKRTEDSYWVKTVGHCQKVWQSSEHFRRSSCGICVKSNYPEKLLMCDILKHSTPVKMFALISTFGWVCYAAITHDRNGNAS